MRNVHAILLYSVGLPVSHMEWEEQRDFVKTALGPQMKAAGLSTKIYAFDHNYNYDNIESQKNYPGKIYEDAAASQYLAGPCSRTKP